MFKKYFYTLLLIFPFVFGQLLADSVALAEVELYTTLQTLKKNTSPEVVACLRDIEQAISLLNEIVVELNAGKLAILKPSFEKLCSYPILIEDLKLRDLRRFVAKLEKIETFIKNSCEDQKALFTKEDLVLCDKVCLLCQILSSRIFDKQNFEFGAVDSFVDTVIFRPLDWIRKNPDVAIVSAIPVVLGAVVLGIVFGNKESDYVPPSFDAEPLLIPESMKECDVKDESFWSTYETFLVLPQQDPKIDQSCGAKSLARALQRINNVEEHQTEAYFKQKLNAWCAPWKEYLAKQIANNSRINLCECRLRDNDHYFSPFNWMYSDEIMELIKYEQVKLKLVRKNTGHIAEEDVFKSMNDNRYLTIFDYNIFLQCMQSLDSITIIDRLYKRNGSPYPLLPHLGFLKDALKSKQIDCAHIIVGPITRVRSSDGRSHFMHYEITRSQPGSPVWFHIRCESTLNYPDRMLWGASVLYKFFKAESEYEWVTQGLKK